MNNPVKEVRRVADPPPIRVDEEDLPRSHPEATRRLEEKAERHAVPEGELVYRAIRQQGDSALAMPTTELMWSGLAAGLSMGFSMVGEGLLTMRLPDAGWTPLVAEFGYSLGFLIVVLGRQQLFTEQTLTAVLPLFSKDRPQGTLLNVVRLWTVVLLANFAGSLVFAAAAAWTPMFSPAAREAFAELGRHAVGTDIIGTFWRAVPAGFLIATMVWLLPAAGAARIWIIVAITYLVGLGGFSHIIAGSAEAFFVVFTGDVSAGWVVVAFVVPTLLGNSAGGVALVAALAHAQHAPVESR